MGEWTLKVVILDEGQNILANILAVSSHVALVVGAERSMSRGSDSSKGEQESKL